jgi:hypothetical protein
MIEGSRAGFVLVTNGSGCGSGRPKNISDLDPQQLTGILHFFQTYRSKDKIITKAIQEAVFWIRLNLGCSTVSVSNKKIEDSI